ncbi:Ig-like domain-containing protein [Arthrobacter sp. D2-10]
MIRGLDRRKRALVSGTALAVAAAVVGAVLNPGVTTAEVDLNDGGVWVTNLSQGKVGHLNYPSRTLDGGFIAGSNAFDVLQRDATVLNHNQDQGALSQVSITAVTTGDEQELPGNGQPKLGTDYVVSVNAGEGTVRTAPVTSLATFASEDAPPLVEGATGVAAAITPLDVVVTADPASGDVVTWEADGTGAFAETSRETVEGIRDVEELQLTTVGDDAVALDPSSGTLFLPGGKQTVLPEPDGARLQQSGPASPFVAVATAGALVSVPLDGSEPSAQPIEVSAEPSAPVQQDGCVHAAWAAAGIYVRDCSTDSNDVTSEIPSLNTQSELVFRTNRNVVVLNDIRGGNIWLVQQNMQLVQNWDEIIPPPEEDDKEDEESASENPINTLPDRTKENQPPVAEDDELGARVGSTTLLPVLDNDSDPDGDLLTVTVPEGLPDVGAVQPVYDATGLQVVLEADVPPGRHTFDYAVDDGRGGRDTASVTLNVRSADSNEPPLQKRKTRIVLEQGQSANQHILADWTDADGDDLYLQSATATTDGDSAKHRDDGLLTFTDGGAQIGEKEVAITVSDGRETTEGVVVVDVRAPGEVPPIANPDHLTVNAGEELLVAPLENDLDPSGRGLRLTRINGGETAEVTPNYEVGTFTFRSDKPGPVYLDYVVANGPASAPGIIRIDVLPEGGEAGAPVAVRDSALLPTGGQTLVDVLANDTDPGGGVLVVQSVSLPADSPVTVAVLSHSILRISDTRGLKERITFSYSVSNGRESSTGQVSVVPIPAPAKLQPPRAADDEITVRAGDVATVEVLSNDTHPNGGVLTLDPELVETVAPGQGLLAVSGNSLRFKAGTTPGTYRAIYAVRGPDGQEDSAQVQFRVTAVDEENNSRPLPETVKARAIAGNTTRIPIPLTGIDPDGDSVSLVGIDQAPTKGTVRVGATFIEYTAATDISGQDSFSYVVTDRFGARSTGTVLLGIALPSTVNQVPVPVDDSVDVLPGRNVTVDVLSNDSDPDGDALALLPDGLEAAGGINAEVHDRKVRFTSPEQTGTTAVRYTVDDGRGGTAMGTVRVQTRPDAPRLAPVAHDDRISFSETLGKAAVDVPVLENDTDRDGSPEELQISFPEPSETASVRPGDGDTSIVNVQLLPQAQTIPYTVTDIDGLSATAFIHVPGSANQPPALLNTGTQEVMSGEELVLDLTELVVVREGRSVQLTDDAKVTAVASNNEPLVRDATTLVFTSAEDYSGAASVSFEVTDGTSVDDPEGLKSMLTVSIMVLPDPNRNHPPEARSGHLQVAQQESGTIDLAKLVQDIDEADTLTFALLGDAPEGLTADLDGSVLSVAAGNAAKNQAHTIRFSATDGRSDPVEAAVNITVVSSTRPLAVANDDVEQDAVQGETVLVDVLANDTNPFPDTPLKLISVSTETGLGSASAQSDSVAVTPADDFVGTMVVQYRIGDRTSDPEREVDGRIRLTVKGAPDAPSTPSVGEVSSQTVVLSWDPPADNGSRITGYRVSGSGGVSQDCPATTCSITGLTNNTEYTFTVVAANDVGESPASGASASARPDEKPSTPAPPRLVFGDRSLSVAWDVPATEGSPVENYDLEISPAPPTGEFQKTGIAGTAVEWEGLENGIPYKVRVRAFNKAPDPSDWSSYSASEIPAGVPAIPAAPTAQVSSQGGSTNSVLSVSWAQPSTADKNGAEIESYTLTTFQNGSALRSAELSGSVFNTTVTVPNSQSPYTFTLTATNKAGTSAASAPSEPRQAVGAPGPVPNVQATPADRSLTVKHGQPETNGATAQQTRYEYQLNNGAFATLPANGVIGGLSNGTEYTVGVRAVNTANGSSFPGPSTQSNPVVPFGQPNTPSISSSPSGEQVVFSIGATPSNGRPVQSVTWEAGGASGSVPAGGGQATSGRVGYDRDVTITVTVTDSEGQRATKTATGRTSPAPKKYATVNDTDATGTCEYPVSSNDKPANRANCSDAGGTWRGIGYRFEIECITPNGGVYPIYDMPSPGRFVQVGSSSEWVKAAAGGWFKAVSVAAEPGARTC